MPRKKNNLKAKKWTVEEIRLLRRLANGMNTAADIAEKLPGRSKDAVRAKLVSLRLSNRIISEEEKKKRKGVSKQTNKSDVEIERSLYAQKAIELFRKKYPKGTPRDNHIIYGDDALRYWLRCVTDAHNIAIRRER